MNLRHHKSTFIAVLMLSTMATPALFAASIDEIRMWRAPDHTRLVFDLSDGIQYSLFTLDNPYRVVIDIADSELNDDFSGLDFSDSPISELRSGIREGDDLRIVLDLTAEVNPSSFTLLPNSELGDRLVVDLYDLGAPVSSTPITLTPAPDRSQDRREIVVAISAGHGGEDPGSIGYDGHIKEKNVTLAISRALFNRLENIPGYRPIMIRESDYYVELQRRPQIAREHRADLLVAIHVDWYRNSRASGVTIYALSGDRADRENARRVTEKENSSDLLGGVGGDLTLGGLDDDVALTLVSLQMAWSMEQSLVAGTSILATLDGVTRLRRDKVQQASLQVLNSPDIPSILIETGYLTNPAEARKLNSSSFQRQMAAALAQGIMNYFYDAPPVGSLVAWQKANGVNPGSYTVKKNDNLSEIAERFGISLAELKSVNKLRSNTIHVGQILALPGGNSLPVEEHTIRRGETLSEIAAQYRVSLSSLRQANDIADDRIMIGQILKIPTI